MGNEKKISLWSLDIIKRIKDNEGIDFIGLSLYNIQYWGFSDGMLKKYLDNLQEKGFIEIKNKGYFWVKLEK
jgi:hypothetical protein